jgi:hypothetical protein
MTTKNLERSLNEVLSPRRLAEVQELASADCSCEARPLDVLHWMRLNMPVAAQRVEELVAPAGPDW